MKERILFRALELFTQRGIKSTSMDDIAQQLGISKKTIYKWFETKDNLIEELLQTGLCTITNPQPASQENAVEEFCLTLNHLIQKFIIIPASFFNDLRKYHPAAHQLWDNYRVDIIWQLFRSNFNRGIQTGLYRADLDPEILTQLYVCQLEGIFYTESFPPEQFKRLEIYRFNVKLFVCGIVSPSGQNYLNNLLT